VDSVAEQRKMEREKGGGGEMPEMFLNKKVVTSTRRLESPRPSLDAPKS
jgi:hypothetical protein